MKRTLEEIVKDLPEEIRLPIYEAFQVFQRDIIREELIEVKGEIKRIWEAIDRLAEAQERTEKIVSELAEAQRRTEGRVGKLEEAVAELIEAHKRSEGRITRLEEAVTELIEAQRRTEGRVDKLEEAVTELIEAQRRTEGRVDKLEEAVAGLIEAQRRTEEKVTELAEAQRRMQEELRILTRSHYNLLKEHKKTREELGGLSNTVGYVLENEAFKALPRLLKRDYGITVKGRLVRKFLKDKEGRHIEVNIVGEGVKEGKRLMIIGESKAQLSKRKVDEFLRRKIKRFEGVYEEIFPVLVTHMISEPDVEGYAKEKGIVIYYSYEF